MTKERKYPLIKEVTLNNKGRKGKYVYVKLKKGERASYYKKKKGLKKEDYIESKKFGIVAKRKGVTTRKTIEKYIKRIKTGKRIETILGKGVTSYTVKNAENLTPYGMKISYMSLLTNKENKFKNSIVKDKLLAEILSRPENVNKFKQRIEYQVSIIGQNGKELATLISAHKSKTLEEVKTEIMNKIKIGQDITSEGSPDFSKEMSEYNVIRKGSGKVKSINIKYWDELEERENKMKEIIEGEYDEGWQGEEYNSKYDK